MDISSIKTYPSGALSNFAPHSFVFDSIPCSSMEGLLQAFKFEDKEKQIEVCSLSGIKAKQQGRTRNSSWKSKQTLWWMGISYKRDGIGYQQLLDRAYTALSMNDTFCQALLDSGEEKLEHSIGESKITNTVLTEEEFCVRLIKIRTQLQADNSL